MILASPCVSACLGDGPTREEFSVAGGLLPQWLRLDLASRCRKRVVCRYPVDECEDSCHVLTHVARHWQAIALRRGVEGTLRKRTHNEIAAHAK
jgi:hypothetical protein